MDPERAQELRSALESNLAMFHRIESPAPLVSAAVAVVVLGDDEGKPCIPLYVRASSLASHPGQFALPGGKLNRDEHAGAGALRELREELGLDVSAGGILGSLDDFDTRSGFTITPVVVWSGGAAAALEPSADEVAQLFLVTLTDLHMAVARAEQGTSPAFCLEFAWGPVYAPTAAILYQFSEVALDGRSHRVNDFYQPPFTHR